MGCTKMLSGASFALITILSIGVVSAMTGYVIYFLLKSNIKVSEPKIITFSCIALAFSLVFFLICIIIPCFNVRCLKMATSYLYIVYALFLIATVIVLYMFRMKFKKIFDDTYEKDPKLFPCQFLFPYSGCGGQNDTISCPAKEGHQKDETKCKDAFIKKIDHRMLVFSIVMIAIVVLLIFGIIVAFYIACQSYTDSEIGVRLTATQMTSLTYGW